MTRVLADISKNGEHIFTDIVSGGATNGLPTGATVVDTLTSTSATNALSANQGKVLNDYITTVTTGSGSNSNANWNYSKIGKIVNISIGAVNKVSSLSAWAETTLGTLPAELRPSITQSMASVNNSDYYNTVVKVFVKTTGAITLYSGNVTVNTANGYGATFTYMTN